MSRFTRLPSGEGLPVLGQGTWGMAEDARRRSDEIAALRVGIELGMTLIDTAEMYADGGAESLVGEAIAGRRDRVFLVSKVLPNNADGSSTFDLVEVPAGSGKFYFVVFVTPVHKGFANEYLMAVLIPYTNYQQPEDATLELHDSFVVAAGSLF